MFSPLATATRFTKVVKSFREIMTKLSFPFTEEKIRALKADDEVLISSH
jgi:hypothetical protein